MSNLAKAYMGNLDLHPLHHISGKVCVTFSMEEKQTLINSMNFIVVVKFSHFRPKFHVFYSFLKNMGFLGKFRIMEFDFKHIFVEFLVFEDFCKLWMLKSCVIGGYRGRFFKWDGNFSPSVESFVAPIWVHLPHFPLYLFNEKAILSVASVFGQPLAIDTASWNRDCVGKLSVCVAKDVRIKGPNDILVEFVGEGIVVDRFSQVVCYGEIPDFCNRCSHLGHSIGDCKFVAGMDKILGPISHRLQIGETGGIGSDVPIASVFDRIHVVMQEKDKEEDQKTLDRDLVLVEDVLDGDDEGCRVSKDKPAEIPKTHMHDLILDSSLTPSLEPISLVSVDEQQGFPPGSSGMELLVDDRAHEAEKTQGNQRLLMETRLPNDSSSISDKFAAPTLETSNITPGAVMLGSLVGESSMVSKVAEKANMVMEAVGEEQEKASGKTDDDLLTADLSKCSSDSSSTPSLKPHNSLCGDNGAKALGVLETRVNKLKISSRFGPLATVNDEEIAVENCVLQEKSADCVEEATLEKDFSLVIQDEEGNPTATESHVEILQNAEEMGAKSSMVCSETDLENRVWQNSAADSDEEATLLEDFSQLVQGGSKIPIVSERQVTILQDAKETKAKATVVCPEKSLEDGDLLQSAAVFNEKPTLRGHISASRDNQDMKLGATESSIKDLQNDVSLGLIAAVSDEISSDEDGGSSYAVPTLNEHISCPGGDTELILGPTESQEDHLQVQGDKQENLMQQVPLMKANDDCSPSTLPISNNLMLLDQAVETYKEGAMQSFDGVSLGFAQQVLSLLQHLMLSTPRASQSESSHTPKVVIKHPVTESKAGNASDLNHKVPKERFDFPPKSSTSSHSAPKKASKKFHKQFYKPP